MFSYKVVIFILCFHAFSAFASGNVTCDSSDSQPDWTSIHTNLELKPDNVNITVGSNLLNWQVIYELDNIVMGRDYTTCNNSYTSSSYTLINAGNIAGTHGTETIYETDVPGIGISVSDENNHAIPVFPTYSWGVDYPSQGRTYKINVKFWKIPGKTIPLNNGSISVTGPEVAGLVGVAQTDVIIGSQSDRILIGGDNPYHYINSSRVLHGMLIFQPGTCNIEGDDVRVDMGNYDESGAGHSDWKDASFKLVCPDAYGYHGSADAQGNTNYPYQLSPSAKITANNMPNGRVQVSIVPYTEVVDANKGIIALDGTGAQGYGIQLAWGDYSTQSSVEPAKPVVLNSYVDANSLNSAFLAGDTPIGGNGFSGGDNTIKMAARYIRTTGDTAPGPANAVVQVIANYQ